MLYTEGGVYLDTDVMIKQRFDSLLDNRFFSSVEYHPKYVQENNVLGLLFPDGSPRSPQSHIPGIAIQSAVMGAEKGHPFLRDCMSWYQDRHFIISDNTYATQLLAPDVFAMVAVGYGFRYLDKEQLLQEGMRIYPSTLFAGTPSYDHENAFAIHCCLGSWRDKEPPKKKLKGVARFKKSLMKRVSTLNKCYHSAWMPR